MNHDEFITEVKSKIYSMLFDNLNVQSNINISHDEIENVLTIEFEYENRFILEDIDIDKFKIELSKFIQQRLYDLGI